MGAPYPTKCRDFARSAVAKPSKDPEVMQNINTPHETQAAIENIAISG
jgi:hypothetical protein